MTLIVVGLAWVVGLAATGVLGGPWWMGAAWLGLASPGLFLRGPLAGRHVLLGACVCGALLGGWRLESARSFSEPPWLSAVGQEVGLTAEVVSEPNRGERTTSYIVDVRQVQTSAGQAAGGGQILVYLHQYEAYLPGDILTLEGELELPPVFDTFDYRAYLARQGISATMYRPEVVLSTGGDPSPGRWLTRQRLRLDESLQRSLPEPEASLAGGIAFGRDDGMSREELQLYNRAGLRHLVAVSGSNVSLVVALTYALAIPVVGRRWAWIPASATLACYLAAAGLAPSVVRSGTMAAILLGGSVVGRPQSGLPALAGAVVAMTAISPGLALDTGFQLSATATAGIITLSPRFSARLLSVTGQTAWLAPPRWVCEALSLTLAASLATTPIAWATFGQVSLVSPLANAVVQPVFAVALWASMATAVLGLVSRDAGELAGVFAYYPLAFIAACAHLFGRPSWAAVATQQVGAEFALASYAVLAPLALAGYRFIPNTERELVRVRKARERTSRLILAAAGGATALALLPVTVLPANGPGELSVALLDVGQGDAALVTTPHGHQVLIDAGPGGLELMRQLGDVMPHWDRTLDAAILTHPQEDHIAGLPEALNRLKVATVLNNGVPRDTISYLEVERRSSERSVLRRGDTFELDGVRFEVLWPADELDEELNNTSVIVRIEYGTTSFLFTGDSEGAVHEALQATGDLPADVLKVPHHGSKTTPPWLFPAVSPAIAVISVGNENPFGHPHADTLTALAGIQTYRTDLDGRVTVRSNGTRLRVSTSR